MSGHADVDIHMVLKAETDIKVVITLHVQAESKIKMVNTRYIMSIEMSI